MGKLFTEATALLMLAEMREQNNYLSQLTCAGTKALSESSGAGLHNSFFRGKNLGSTFTAAQSAAIRAGTFEDLWVGDYWPMNVAYTYEDENGATQSGTYSGVMVVAECNYYRYKGVNDRLNTNHILVVPSDAMFSQAVMNDEATREGGYLASKMHTVYMKRAAAIFKACFGADHVLPFPEKLSNSDSGLTGTWATCEAELMSERMLFGSAVEGMDYYYHTGNHQAALFRHSAASTGCTNTIWLRDIGRRWGFVYMSSTGSVGVLSANYGSGVRPYALIY